ncbi:MAG TPA: ATP synthase subunit I [Desulfonatronum sp.]|nr:ATP synthase subunit I [Desulfonatronum sp.]
MTPITRTNARIENFLWHQGFILDEVRVLVRNQIYCVCLGLAFLMLTHLHPWAIAFLSGTVLITVNFWLLAKGLQGIIHTRDGAVAISLLRFYGRLILTGLVLFGLIVWGGLPVPALLAGLSTVVLNILLWGVFRFHRQKVKEA